MSRPALGLLLLFAAAVVVPSAPAVAEHTPDTGRDVRAYWTPGRMRTVEARQSGTGALWNRGGVVARTTGKVFFTSGGLDLMCSASTVRSSNKDVVVTAGHCVKPQRGTWAENWIFVPGYRDGASPYGGYVARKMFAPDQWTRHADGDFDVAMVALTTSDGRHAADVVGAQRIAFGGPGGDRTFVFGYPTTGRYDGNRLAYCDGRPAKDPRGGTTGRGLRCDLTIGSSGGPWLTGFDPATGHGTVRSVSSWRFTDDRRTMYGPRFGEAVRRVYDRARNA